VNVKLVVVGLDTFVDPVNTSYPVTPTLSDDAFHESVIEVCPTPLVARPVGADGADVSEHASVDTLFVAVAELLPAASWADTPSV
jgi:hypothetical protein